MTSPNLDDLRALAEESLSTNHLQTLDLARGVLALLENRTLLAHTMNEAVKQYVAYESENTSLIAERDEARAHLALILGIESRVNAALNAAGCYSALPFEEHIARIAAERDAARAEVERLKSEHEAYKSAIARNLLDNMRSVITPNPIAAERDQAHAEVESWRKQAALKTAGGHGFACAECNNLRADLLREQQEVARLRPVVEAAARYRGHFPKQYMGDFSAPIDRACEALVDAVDAYRAALPKEPK